MKQISIYTSYKRLFAVLILFVNSIFVLLFISECTITNELLFSLAGCDLVFASGLFIKVRLLTIKEYSLVLKNGEELPWDEIAEIEVGKKIRNLSFREKIPNPFAPYGIFSNYYLTITPVDQPKDSNVMFTKKFGLNFSELHPDVIEELLWNLTRGTSTIMYRDESVE